jgi:tripartite-type tricarboxylate transporter receptor subunit TctC
LVLGSLAAAFAARRVHAQAPWPTKPVRFIVPFARAAAPTR